MIAILDRLYSRARSALLVVVACSLPSPLLLASPAGPTVSLGSASFSSQGSQLTIQTSDRAFINWQSFNIGVGQTTTFLQPSSSSVVWNQINDPNPSQILGTLNANGYVVLQNQAGCDYGFRPGPKPGGYAAEHAIGSAGRNARIHGARAVDGGKGFDRLGYLCVGCDSV